MIPPNPPEPTALSGETPIALLTDASLVEMLEVSCAYCHPAEAPSDELRAYQGELRAELLSRLSALHTELERTRRERDEATEAALERESSAFAVAHELADAQTEIKRLTDALVLANMNAANESVENNDLRAALERTRTENERLREALGDIANPIGYLRRLCEIEGKILNGPGAAHFASSASALQEIATKALRGSPDATTRRTE